MSSRCDAIAHLLPRSLGIVTRVHRSSIAKPLVGTNCFAQPLFFHALPSQVTAVTAKVALRAVAGVDVDMSSFLKDFKDGLVEEVADCALDEDALFRVVAGEQDAATDMQRDARASYEALKTFIDKEHLSRRKKAQRVGDGYGYIDFREKMQRVSDGKGGMVWVRTENVEKWRDSLSAGCAPSR